MKKSQSQYTKIKHTKSMIEKLKRPRTRTIEQPSSQRAKKGKKKRKKKRAKKKRKQKMKMKRHRLKQCRH